MAFQLIVFVTVAWKRDNNPLVTSPQSTLHISGRPNSDPEYDILARIFGLKSNNSGFLPFSGSALGPGIMILGTDGTVTSGFNMLDETRRGVADTQ